MNFTHYFCRGGQYDYLVANEDLYDSFDLVATDVANPPLIAATEANFGEHIPLECQKGQIFCSDRLRTIQSAASLSKTPIILPELHEIHYSMHDFISKADFYSGGTHPNVTKARKAFVNALIHDQLSESYSDVIARVKQIVDHSRIQQSNAVYITHGFLLKVLQAYISDERIAQEPSRLLEYFTGETQTFPFSSGFAVTIQGKENI